ncbi:MAG: replicative DNA helicase, partial [Actinobacteria bacterium]|nr:replicative DNA helicase [Actinomycetota bacterium]
MAQQAVELHRAGGARIPPHNLEAEESLLGAMLLSRDAIAVAVESIKPDDFYKPAHAHVFDAVLALYGAGEPVDPVTVAEELRRAGLLEAVGGRNALLSIQGNTPASANASHYARIVEELALLRRLIVVAGEIAEMGYELPDDVTETLDLAESKVFAVAERRVSTTMVGLHEVLQESLDQLEALYGRDVTVTGAPTGYLDFDDLLHGLQPSTLVVVAARPSVGKTAFALGMATNVALEARRPVIFFSLEMGHLELTQRLLAAEARVDSRKLRRGDLADADWTRIAHAVGRLGEAPFFIDDNPHCTVMEMRAKSRRLKARFGDLGLVVVDYLQLMSSPTGRNESRQVEVSELSRGLKILARELETPVVALSQLNRMPEMRQDKRPMLADLRESGCLTADTKIVRADTGEAVTLGQLLATGERDIPVHTVDHDYRIVRGIMTHVFRSGAKPVYRLRLRSGLEVKASPNHPFLTFDGWRRLDELRLGERLGIPRRLPEPERPVEWPDDQVVLLAHLLGAGTFAVDQPLTYISADARHLEAVERAALTLGVQPRRVDRGAYEQLYLSPPYHPCAWRENQLVDWLEG